MKKSILFLLIGFLVVSFYSCYYDKADLLYPTGATVSCDTSTVISYSQKVVPLLKNQCYGCHTPTGGSGGINMGTYATDKAIAVNGKLYGSISHAAGFVPMPQGTSKMTTCQLAAIKKWIDGGTLNN